jgi:hypothetical protein
MLFGEIVSHVPGAGAVLEQVQCVSERDEMKCEIALSFHLPRCGQRAIEVSLGIGEREEVAWRLV